MNRITVNILDLSDEVLVYICSYLSSSDITLLAQVNTRFDKICSEKSVVRNLNLKDAYGITKPILRTFLLPKFRCNNISVLNLNYCHWLPAESFTQIPKLANLKELHILDCRVSFANLTKILSALKLTALSCTWPVEKVKKWKREYFHEFGASLSVLQHLVVHISNFLSVIEIEFFLCCCPNLERFELFLINFLNGIDGCSVPQHFFLAKIPDYQLKHLKHFKIDGFKNWYRTLITSHVVLFFRTFLNATASLNAIWFDDGSRIVLPKPRMNGQLTSLQIASADILNFSDSKSFHYSQYVRVFDDVFGDLVDSFFMDLFDQVDQMQCRELSLNNSIMTTKLLNAVAQRCPNLEKISMAGCLWHNNENDRSRLAKDALKLLVDNCVKITHLDMSMAQDNCISISCLTSLKYLVNLSISPNLLSKKKSVERRDQNSGSRRGVQTQFSDDVLKNTVLWPITEACPLITKLQILDMADTKYPTRSCSEAEYVCISRLHNLTHLHIQDSLYRNSGHFLVDVLKNCTGLVSLRLKRLGSECRYIQQLSCALVHAKSLENLWIRQRNLHLPVIFFENLANCSHLVRLGLSYLDTHPQLPVHMKSLVEKLPKLVMLYVWMKVTNIDCKNLRIALRKFKDDRPAFTHFICNEDKKSLSALPPHIFRDGFTHIEL